MPQKTGAEPWCRGAKPAGMRWFRRLSGCHRRTGHCLGCAVPWPKGAGPRWKKNVAKTWFNVKERGEGMKNGKFN